MKIHEYQGKELLKTYGVPVPRGIVARTPKEAEHQLEAFAEKLDALSDGYPVMAEK